MVDAGPEQSLRQAFAQATARIPTLLPEALPALVVIKPNLCDIASWETGVTTDPIWLAILASALRARRADVRIMVVESDAISAYKSFRSCDETFDRLGYREAAQEADIELVNLSREDSWDVSVPGLANPLRIPELLLQEFFYISLANVKVHPYERFTGTLKNALGLLPQADISSYHVQLPELIAALYRLCTPDLAILDGRIGLEGKGPIIGQARRLGKIVLGRDGLAVDACGCRLIGMSPDDVPHLRGIARASDLDLGQVVVEGQLDPVQFEFDPENSHDAILAKFAVRRFHRKLEQWGLRDGMALSC